MSATRGDHSGAAEMAIAAVLGLADTLLMYEDGRLTEEERLRIVRLCGRARDIIDMISPAGRRHWAEQVTANTDRITITREILALAQHRDPRIVGVGLAQIADRIAP